MLVNVLHELLRVAIATATFAFCGLRLRDIFLRISPSRWTCCMAELAASTVAFRSHPDRFVILPILMTAPLLLCDGAVPAYGTSFSGLPNLSIP